MRSGFSARSRAMAGSAVLRIVPSSDCMKKAIATTQGSQRAVLASRGARFGMGSLLLGGYVSAIMRYPSLLFPLEVRLNPTASRARQPGNPAAPGDRQRRFAGLQVEQMPGMFGDGKAAAAYVLLEQSGLGGRGVFVQRAVEEVHR